MKQPKQQQEQQRSEQLSALLDNALDEQQLDSFMQDLKRDPIADAEATQRYRLMGDVMRDEVDQSSFMDISAAVHRAIENESELTEEALSRQNQNKFNPISIFSKWLKPLTGMAVAASVAMVTLVTFNTVQTRDSSENVSRLAQTQVAPSTLAPSQFEKVNPDISRNVRVASTLDANKTAQQQKQLNIYMLQHSGYASQATMQGMMPYVRAADVKAQEKD